MHPKLQELMELIQSKKKTEVPWKPQQPTPQPYYTFSSDTNSWEEASPSSSEDAPAIERFAVLSWNIDFMLPCADERMLAALNYLHSHLSTASTIPTVIFFQEMVESNLNLIQSQPWIRSSYHLTDLDNTHWESGHYGTCTLIPKSLPVASVFRVHYEATRMERDGLFVDINIGGFFPPPPQQQQRQQHNKKKVLRLCNTHLESLIVNPPLRPAQVSTAAQYMHAPEVAASVLAGDLNAIQPFDRNLHTDNNLHDAYLSFGGSEDSDDGYTWGQTAPVKQRDMFGCSRMDKVFFCCDDDATLQLVAFERLGLRVAVDDERLAQRLVEEVGLDGGWVTDHTAVKAEFRIVAAVGKGEGMTGSKVGSKM